jgi:hypothetical protein
MRARVLGASREVADGTRESPSRADRDAARNALKGVFRTHYNERPIHRHMRYGRVTPTAVNST